MSWRPTAAGLPPEFLRACLLLLLAERDAHGYQLCEELCGLGLEMGSASIYRQLREMEEDGLTASHWELSDTGPPRRTYAITEAGRGHLRRCTSSIVETVGLLQAFLTRGMDVLDDEPRTMVTPASEILVLGEDHASA